MVAQIQQQDKTTQINSINYTITFAYIFHFIRQYNCRFIFSIIIIYTLKNIEFNFIQSQPDNNLSYNNYMYNHPAQTNMNAHSINIQSVQRNQPKSQTIIHGTKKVTSFLIFFIPLLLTAPLISYHMAVKKGEQHKYPHPTITDTACHYPQDIQFRLIMAGSGSFLSFIYWILFRWMRYQKQKTQYPGTIYGPLYYIGQLSVWGYMIAMGTIDGMWYPDLHTNSAIFFFLTLFLIVMTQTLVLRDMYLWDSSVISRNSYIIKLILAIYVAIVWVCTLTGLVTHPSGSNDDENVYIVVLEWNSVYVCIFWILSYYPQWSNIRITLTQTKINQ